LKGYKRLIIVFTSLICLVILCAKCIGYNPKEEVTAETHAGSATCKNCHSAIYKDYQDNAHNKTSKGISLVHGLTDAHVPESDTFAFTDKLKIVVEERNKGMYQVAYLNGKETISRRFDIAIGSGKRAYTYGYWSGKQLKQLPLSYYTVINQWANSPGFPKDVMYYDRPIGSRCLECHSSFVDRKITSTGSLSTQEELLPKSLIYGIDCERCHGPAGKHVEFHTEHPAEKQAKYITLYSALTRKQKIDACAVCHSGNDVEQKKSIFAFKPEDKLDDYYDAGASAFISHGSDVHGNHTQLMQKSACYIKSNTLTCNSCHNTHEDLKVNLKIYSNRCMSCHQSPKHSAITLAKGILKDNCIDCHMPNQASKQISFQMAGSGKISAYMLRTHEIAVYPDARAN
jgi:hypothetical protein